MVNILAIDDDRDMCLLLKKFLTNNGFNVSVAYNSKQALELLEVVKPDLVLCDFRLDIGDGKTMLLKIKEIYPLVPVINITAYSDIKIAVEVMKLGAYDYITKPFIPGEILLTIKNALKEQTKPVHVIDSNDGEDKQARENKPQVSRIPDNGEYVFEQSPSLRLIVEEVSRVAPTNYSVILYGESGSGKEVIAQEIHKRSNRHDKPFVAIDCGALSRELAGSELFGHEKGAFTGAMNQKTGSFELANGGTIFLDEIANLSYDIQISLLRVIQERKLRRVGGVKDIALDVRIIVASNEKLWDASKKGKFREDLFHRFNEFSVTIPPLRERKEDIMMFAHHFLRLTNQELNKNILGFSPEVEEIFKSYVWYGNLRELKNVVKRAVLLTDGDYIRDRSLPFEISNFNKLLFEKTPATPSLLEIQPVKQPIPESRTMLNETTLKGVSIDAEYEMILEALKQTNFNKSKAARFLHIDRKTLYNKMKQYQQLNNH